MPEQAITFEISDAWLEEANVTAFSPSAPAYVASFDPEWPALIVPLSEVVTPKRNPGVVGLHKERAISIICAIAAGQAVPSIAVDEPPESNPRYRLRDGYHRFYISIALGFSHLPLSVKPYFEL